MRQDWKVTEEMPHRELKLGELLIMALDIAKKHIGSLLLLTLLAYLPEAAGLQYQLSKVVVTEDLTALAEQLMPVVIWSAVLSFISMIGPLVAAVLVREELLGEERPRFVRVFDSAIRCWIFAAITQTLLICGLGVASLSAGVFIGVLPLAGMIILPLMVLVLLYYGLLQSGATAMASLHRMTGWHCLRYLRGLFQNRLPRVLGVYALVWLIGTLPSQLIQLLVSELLADVAATWLVTGITIVLQTLLGVLTLYIAIAVTILLLNYEMIRQREWKEMQEKKG